MTRLNKVSTYAILWLNSIGKSNEEICKEIKVTEKQVDNLIKKTSTNAIKTKSEKVKGEADPSQFSKMMIKDTQNKNKGVAIMTPGAAAITDGQQKSDKQQMYDKNIFKMRK